MAFSGLAGRACRLVSRLIPCVLTWITGFTEQPIRRAPYATASTVQHVGIDHRCPHVPVAQQLLDRPNVIPGQRTGDILLSWSQLVHFNLQVLAERHPLPVYPKSRRVL